MMALGDGIRRNIAMVEPAERILLRDALIEMNKRFFPGNRADAVPGGVTWWFKQDEIHQSTHVHGGPEFIPWHREIVNRLEAMLRTINPKLSLHYWDWTQDPRSIPNANVDGPNPGTLDLFTPSFMGYGGSSSAPIGEPWLSAGYYVPGANPDRDSTDNPADPPDVVNRSVNGSPATTAGDTAIVNAGDYAAMRVLLENVHDAMHGFVNMGGQHISFRDPFVFLLHSNVDRLYARWQTDPAHPERLDPSAVYGTESGSAELNGNVEPWSTGHSFDSFNQEHFTRPWYAPESQGVAKNYKHPSVVFPPCYDTNQGTIPLVEVVNAGTPPVINFNDIPEGDTGVRAAVFRVYGCNNVTIRVKAGLGPSAPFSLLQPPSGSVTVAHDAHQFVEVRLWLAYTAGTAGVAVPDGSVTFECPQNNQEFAFVLRANAIVRPRVAVMMALDQSGSMDQPAGGAGATRLEVLKDSARKFMELIQKDHGVGLIRFDHNSYAINDPTFPGLTVTKIAGDDIFDPGRIAAVNAVNSHATNPLGNTSVGDGVDRARQELNAVPAADYDHKALIVLTDGLENDPLWISDVAGSIDSRTFAIGLGNEQQVNTTALRALANSTGGYLLLTGLLSSSIDDYFRLSKYFLQILAGVTNSSIIVDPSGFIAPGSRVRVPFRVNEADIACTVVLMTDENVVGLTLETPDGTVIDPTSAAGLGIGFAVGAQTRHYRFTLPVGIGAGQGPGLWQAVLEVDDEEYKRALHRLRKQDRDRDDKGESGSLASFATHGARYAVTVQTSSNLRMDVAVDQSGFEPGADVGFRVTLSEYGLAMEHRAEAAVELTRPGGSTVTLAMQETEPGVHELTTAANQAGVYHARIVARGVTLRGTPFTREQLATAAVWNGGDAPYVPPDRGGLCSLIACILGERTLTRDAEERLRGWGVNLDGIRRCLKAYCGRAGLNHP